MKFISNIKENVAANKLPKRIESLKREVEAISLIDAAYIGIIFNASQNIKFESAREYIKLLSASNRKILALGMVEDKKLLDYYSSQKGIVFFARKEINWEGKPKGEMIDKFLEQRFDILFDLTLEQYLPVQYIVGMSKAKFKVGRYALENQYCDFMIDISKNNTLEFLIEQIKHYLSAFDKK